MTSDILKRAAEAVKGVTPGPWRVGPVDDTTVVAADGSEVAAIDGDYNHPDLWPMMEANARFIAAARQLVPDLRDEVLRLRADLARVTAERDAERAVADGLAEKAAPFVSPVQNGDFTRQIRQHDALCAALAAYAKHKEVRS